MDGGATARLELSLLPEQRTLGTASDCADFFFLQEMSFAKVDVGVKYCHFLRMRTEKVL